MQISYHNSSATTSVAPSPPNLQLAPQFISESTAAPLKRAEVRRRLWHMLPGLLPFILAIMERHRPVPWGFLGTIAALAGLLTITALFCYRTIARVGETNWALNALSFSAVTLPLLFLFPAHPELSAVVVTVLAFGDGSATLFGLLYGGQTLPWNPSKTWIGFISFYCARHRWRLWPTGRVRSQWCHLRRPWCAVSQHL